MKQPEPVYVRGPFFSNRAARRSHFRGVEGHHAASKKKGVNR